MKVNYLAIYWFAFGLLFLIWAAVNAYKGDNDRAMALMGVSLACHARCEVKILQQRIEKLEK